MLLHSVLMYFHCLDTDELWFLLIDPLALIWFQIRESTWMVVIASKMVDWYQSLLLLFLQRTDDELTTSSNVKTLLLSNLA